MPAALLRIRDRASFAALRDAPRRVRRGAVVVTWMPGPHHPPRVAFAVGRAAGGAVVRNRLRRRLRAAMAARAGVLAPGTYLVGAGPKLVAAGPELLASNLDDALRALNHVEHPL